MINDTILPNDFQPFKQPYPIHETAQGWSNLSFFCEELSPKAKLLESAFQTFKRTSHQFILDFIKSAQTVDLVHMYLQCWFKCYMILYHQALYLLKGHIIRQNQYQESETKLQQRGKIDGLDNNSPNPQRYLETWISCSGLEWGVAYLLSKKIVSNPQCQYMM